MAEIKPGYKSTEFYGSAAATILGGIAGSGLLSPDMTNLANNAINQIPEAVQIIDSLFDGAIRLLGIVFGIGTQIKYGANRALAKKSPEKVVIRK